MKVKEKNNTIVFKRITEDIEVFAQKILDEPTLFKGKNILIDLEEIALRPSQIIPFEPLAVLQREQKKSFVLVADVDFDERSEEHTSELQSRENLVCRLLLEKKKRQN